MQVVIRGRSAAVARALHVLREARSGGGSAVVTVTGPAGIGKTTVADAIVTEALKSGFRVGWSKAEEIGQIAPGAPLFMALRSGRQPLVGAAQVAAWESLAGDPMRLVEPLSDGLEQLAAHTPVLVALDDVQWVDPLSRAVLRALIGRLAGSAVVWLLSARTSGADVLADLTTMTGDDVPVSAVELGPLPLPDLVQIARDHLGAEPSDAVRQMLAGVGGNPLVAMQIIDGAGRAQERGEQDDRIPTEFILAARGRRDRLDPAAADLVDVAAVLGRPCTAAELAAVQGGPPGALERALASDILRCENGLVSFSHDLLRETVYAGISESRRRALHRRCAHYLVGPGDDLLAAAAHVRAGAKVGDEESAAFLRRAAAYALARVPDSAGRLILDALGLLRPSQPAWIVTAEECVDILCQVDRFADAVRVAELALSRGGDAETNARLHILMAKALFSMGRMAESARRLDGAVRQPGTSRTAYTRLVASRALAMTGIGQADRAREAVNEALRLSREINDKSAVLTALHARGELARNSGHHAEAMAAFNELRLAGEDRPFVAEEVWSLQLLDRYAEAAQILERARADPRYENHAPVVWAQMWQDFNLCRLDEAELDARQLITTSRELGGHLLEIDAYVIFSSTALLRGDLATARQRLSAREAQSKTDNRLREPSLRLLHGWIAAAEGKSAEAMSILSEELATAHQSRTYWPWWPGWMPLLTHFGLAAGDPRFLASCLELAADGAARNPGVASFEGIALHVQGLSTIDLDLLYEAVGVLARSPRPELQASALADTGRALIRRGKPRDGMKHLDRAWDIYRGIGMYAAMKSVQQAMRRAGARRAKWETTEVSRPTSGWAALTPTELEVAKLVSEGLTNRLTADGLGISPNTVGTHLRAIFDKVGVHSRVQLANAYHRDRG